VSERIREAAAVLLVRGEGLRRELFWVRRSREVSLGGGFFAFPGGGVDPQDRALAAKISSANPDASLPVAAARELFEEAGVLLADGVPEPARMVDERRALLARERPFEAVLARLGLGLALDRLQFAGRWLTPPFMPVRFDARFYVATLPPGQAAEVWPGELASGDWITPDEALERWRRGRALLHPPALHLLRCLRDAPLPEALAAMRTAPHVTDFVAERIEFQAGVLVAPVRTPTLPPATHTNTFLVGEEELVVVDPGSVYPEEQQRLGALCAALVREGRRFREILLTHEHHDHVDGVDALRDQLRVPVRAHRETRRLLDGRVRLDGVVEPDERIALPGPLGLTLRALHTPGHTPGHLCFLEETSGALFAGDHVAGTGTVIVDPPEGDMGDYVASLEHLRSLPIGTIYPAHGPTVPDGPRKLAEYARHRREREAQVVEALAGSGGGTAEELVPRVYAELAPGLHPLAARSLTAILLKLRREGRAQETDGRWTPTTRIHS
jgi:glyoxylase-like metal-dependent hydrolase (beta-lactamase superfamily II)/8-oxo-dGTP pyrophosphatase MutT (NUDIX family)